MWFIDSPFFGGLIAGIATLATGWIAIRVFKLQKRDEKVNAAISILFEIRDAEDKVKIISEKLHTNNTNDLPSILPTNSWRKYSHLFAKDFDEDELKLVNNFYNSCGIIEELVNKQNNFFWIATEERARVAQRLLADIHLEFQKDMVTGGADSEAANKTKFDRQRLGITKFYTDEEYLYTPSKTANGLKFQVNNFQNITTTTCGAKLKKLAE